MIKALLAKDKDSQSHELLGYGIEVMEKITTNE